MKQEKYITIIFLIVIFIMPLIFIFTKKIEFSEMENRYLEELPEFNYNELISGELIKDIESYINDHFPFRNTFMNIKTKYQLLIGYKEINDTYIGKNEYLFKKYNDPKNTEKLIDTLNKFKDNNKDINIQIMLVPSSGVINNKYLPENIDFNKELETIEKVYNNINLDTIDVTNDLKEGSKYYDMYYRLDHHWTTYGAYYAYISYCKQNNIEYIPLDKFNIEEVSNNFNGTLYSNSNIYSYRPDKIVKFDYDNNVTVKYINTSRITNTLYEEKYLNKKDKYAYFLDGNHPLIEIETGINNNEEILIIKDSYANSFIPFLTNHYNKIHIIDPRYYNLSITDYIKENNIEKVLFLYNINNIDNDTGIYKIK